MRRRQLSLVLLGLSVVALQAQAAPISTTPDAARIAAVKKQLASAVETYQAALAKVKYTDAGGGIAAADAPPAHQRSQAAWERRFQHADFLPSLPDDVRDALTTPAARRTKAQALAVRNYYLSHANAATRAALHPLATNVSALTMQLDALSDGYTHQDYIREHEYFRQQRLEQAYLLHTQDEGDARAKSLKYFRLYSARAAALQEFDESEQQLSKASRAAGSIDPLVGLYTTMDLRGDPATEEPILRDVLAKLDGGPYSPIAELTARRWYFGCRLGHPEHDEERRARAAAWVAAYVRFASSEKPYVEQQRFVFNQVIGPLNDFNLTELEHALAAFSDAKEMHPWTRAMALGRTLKRIALLHRGDAFDSLVPEDSRKLFLEHMALAKEHFTAAWRLAPHWPEAAALMIEASVKSGDAKPSPRDWFDRAVAAQMDWPDAYHFLIEATLPVWAGSDEELLAFGKECAATERYDTNIPFQLINICLTMANYRGVEIWRNAEVYRETSTLLDNMIRYHDERKEADDVRLVRSWRVALAYQAGKFEDARTAIEQLGGDVDRGVIARAGVTSRDFYEQIEGALSKQHAVIEAAKVALAAEPLDVSVFPDHITALRQFREREMGAARMRADDLIVRLTTVQSFESGHWTEIPFDERLSQWEVLQGDWRSDKDGVVGQDRGTPGMLLRWRHRVPDAYVVEANIELLAIGDGENKGLVPAGIAAGEYHWEHYPPTGRLFWVDSHEKKCGTISGEFDPIGGNAPTKQVNHVRAHVWRGFYIITLNGREFLRKVDASFSPAEYMGLANLMAIPQNHTMRFSQVRLRKLDWPAPSEKTESVEYYNKWIAAEPDNAMAFARRAVIRGINHRDLDGAIADGHEALKLDPHLTEAQGKLGLFYLEKGNSAKAKEMLQQALPRASGSTLVAELLTIIEASAPLDNLRDGASALARAKALNEASSYGDAHHLMLLAAASAETGDFAAAVKWQAKAEELAPRKTDETDRLALYRAGKPSRYEPGPREIVARDVKPEVKGDGPDPRNTQGLIARWPFDEHLRETWLDSETKPQGGDVKYSPGRVGMALNCGQHTCVVVGDVARFERSDAFSYGAWVFVDSHAEAGIVSNLSEGTTKRGHGLLLTNKRVNMQLASNAKSGIVLEVEVPAEVPLTKWFHVYATYDGSSTDAGVKIYLNGRAVGTRTLRNKLTASILSDDALRVGGRANEMPFPGKLDEVRIYNRVLSPDEVRDIMNMPLRDTEMRTWTDVDGRKITAEFSDINDDKVRLLTQAGKIIEVALARLSKADQAYLAPKLPGPVDLATGLVAHWNFDEGAGDEARDAVGEHHGAIRGAEWIKSPRGGALHFDGKDDLVRIAAAETLNFAGDVSLAAWVRPERVAGTPAGASVDGQSILVHGWETGGAPGELYLRMFLRDAGMKYEVGGFLGEEERTADAAVPVDDKDAWVHVAGTFDGRTWRLYRNGKLAGQVESDVGAVKTPAEWGIGGHPTESVRLFQGDIDDVRVYRRALTKDEIAALAK